MNTHQGLDGRPGLAYDYVFAGNGVFIQSANRLLTARFPIATARIAGLPPIAPALTLHHGPIPAAILAQALDRMMTNTRRELYCAVLHDEPRGYHLAVPPQEATGHSVTYQPVAGAVMDIHSHPNNAALFSATDDADETAFRLYAVIGPLATSTAAQYFHQGRHLWPAPPRRLATRFQPPRTLWSNPAPTEVNQCRTHPNDMRRYPSKTVPTAWTT